jgi:putative endonuclease
VLGRSGITGSEAAGSGSGEAHDLGQSAETFVARALQRQGWCVLARNWREAGGELDLVVERRGVLRFVEVKARSPDDGDERSAFDHALESIGANKRRRLVSAAEAWLDLQGLPEREVAFLVALVSMDDTGWSIQWWDDAF